MSGLRSDGTDVGGPGYIHPKGPKYNENFDSIFRKGCGGDCEDCNCEEEDVG
jgi:hypothetical protein